MKPQEFPAVKIHAGVMGRSTAAEAPAPGRQCLHARRLRLQHPRTHEEVEFEAPLPADMAELLAWLREQTSSE